MLYCVPTPIGNLGDITERAKNLLLTVSCVLTEDPRISQRLFVHIGRKEMPTMQIFGGDGVEEIHKITAFLQQWRDQDIVMVTDAGMPGISDPGSLVIRIAQEQKIPYTVLPGPSALPVVVSASGLVDNQFLFFGFLPHKKGRQTQLKQIAQSSIPVVIYESVHRIKRLCDELQVVCDPNMRVFIAREISKSHEEYWWGNVSDLQGFAMTIKGEFSLVIAPASKKNLHTL